MTVGISGPGNVTAGYAPTSFRAVGLPISITATPNTNALFSGWTVTGPAESIAGISPAMLQQPTLTFTMREGLALTANFAANPYAGAVIGAFDGVIDAEPTLPDRAPLHINMGEDGTVRSISTVGRISLTLQPNATFSGSMKIDGSSLSISGAFDAAGTAHFGPTRTAKLIVPRPGKPSLLVAMAIDLTNLSNVTITGTVSALDFAQTVVAVSSFSCYRAGYSSAQNVPGTLVTGASTRYTLILPYIDESLQAVGQNARSYPQGHGIGDITLTKAGALTFAVMLADGTSFTHSTTLAGNRQFHVFAPLYGSKGFLTGNATLDTASDPDRDILITNAWLWTKPQDLKLQHYPNGWQNLRVGLDGAKFVTTSGTGIFKASGGYPLDVATPSGNVTATFSNGQLFTPVGYGVNIDPTTAKATKLTLPTNTFTCTVSTSTLRIGGTFTHLDGTVPTYQAVILQKGARAGAFGFFKTVSPKVLDFTGEVGAVEFIGQ